MRSDKSPAEYLAQKFNFISQFRSLYFKYNKFDEELNDLVIINLLISIRKDFVDTFKPYKSSYYVLRDLIQPLRGIGNIIWGVFNIIATPLIFLVNTLRYFKKSIIRKSYNECITNIIESIKKEGRGFLDGISLIIRGITQLISSPLAWFLKMPLRAFITLIKGKPKAEKKLEKKVNDLKTMLKEQNNSDKIDLIETQNTVILKKIMGLTTKVEKAKTRGQNLALDHNAIKKQEIKINDSYPHIYQDINELKTKVIEYKSNCSEYLNLFTH